MHTRVAFMAALAALALSSGVIPGSDATRPAAGDLRKSGTARLEISCKPEVREDFATALALLHSFFYEEARRRFEEIAREDSECSMAWWGAAMTWYHPLWAPPTPEEMAAGVAAVEKARAIGGKTDLERGLVSAIDAYFRSEDRPEAAGPAAQSCHGPRAHGARAEAFRNALESLHREHPDNLEVTVFYTLALLGTAPPTDKTYANQNTAAAILEPLFEQNPDHPGIPHYIIHAYDYPALAARGLVAARKYGEIAPWVPHALHMPSHIYTRMGMWEDSIQSNRASADAAREYTARVHDGRAWYDELHALDYVVYAYLQTAQVRKADEVLEYVRGLRRFQEPNFAAAYAIGAIPARCALESRRWKDAASLKVLHPGVVKPFPFAVAHTEFARAVGGARSGRLEVARASLARLAELRDTLTEPKFRWWIDQIEIQRLAAAGWLARAEGRDDEALRLLRESGELEDRAGAHPVTPGQILPAREQLGDLLMELGRPAEALVEYEKSLEAFPSRFNGHFGAARAAQLADRTETALSHFRKLVEMAGRGDGRREELHLARTQIAAR
jgi:tetratricopeptide (TPR) repeat protein